MKKNVVRIMSVLLLVAMIFTMVATCALAAKGGLPAAHGLEVAGKEGGKLGPLVSDMAKGEPGAVAAHIHDD